MADLRDTRALWARPLVLQIAVVLMLATLGPQARAHAQDVQQNALARSLFEEGVALADAGDYVVAADRFSRAYTLKPTPGIAFNWAHVLSESGKLLQAQELLMGVSRDEAADAQIRSDSAALLSAVAARIPRLRVHVEGALNEQVRVELDGLDWPRAAWDIASPVDPGAHSVVLKTAEREAARVDLTLADAETRDAVLRVPADEPASEPAPAPFVFSPVPPSASATPVDEAPRPLYKRWPLWAGVGAAVAAGVVVAVVLAAKNDSQEASPVAGNTSPGVLRW